MRAMMHTLLLLLLLAACSHSGQCDSSQSRRDSRGDSLGDASGAAAPGSLPFPLPLPTKESHISSSRHADSLMQSRRMDTTDARHSVWAAVDRRDDTRSFARWVTAALRHKQFQQILRTTPLWTVFAPSNEAVDSYLSQFLSVDPPLSALLAHLIPNISFVLFDAPRPPVALPLLTANQRPAVTLFLCDTNSTAQCEEDAAERYSTPTPNAPADADLAFLLRSEVLHPNRVAGNGVVHVVDRVLTPLQRRPLENDKRSASESSDAGVRRANSANASSPSPSTLVDLSGSGVAAGSSFHLSDLSASPASAYWTPLNIALVSVASLLLLLLSLWGCRHYLHVQSPRLDAAWNAVCCCCPRAPDVDFVDFGNVVSPNDRRPLLPLRPADIGDSYQQAATRTKRPPDL